MKNSRLEDPALEEEEFEHYAAAARSSFLRHAEEPGFLSWIPTNLEEDEEDDDDEQTTLRRGNNVIRLSAAERPTQHAVVEKTTARNRQAGNKPFRTQVFAPPPAQHLHPDDPAYVAGGTSTAPTTSGGRVNVPLSSSGRADEEDRSCGCVRSSSLPCCDRLCQGRCGCFWNAFCCPLVMCHHGFRIYFWPTLGAICCSCWKTLCCSCLCCKFTDAAFPPNDRSLGKKIKGDGPGKEFGAGGKKKEKIQWMRAADVVTKNKETTESGKPIVPKLFSKNLDPAGICQGALGDCWLLSGMACLADHRSAIQHVFETRFIDVRGKYYVTLYDATYGRDARGSAVGAWVQLCVDDYIPVEVVGTESGRSSSPLRIAVNFGVTVTPKFTAIRKGEMWPVLLEKAFAKLCGSYENLEGGSALWALQAMTGDRPYMFELEHFVDEQGVAGKSQNLWKGQTMVNLVSGDQNDKRACGFVPFGKSAVGHALNCEEMWNVVLNFHNRGSVLAGSGVRKEVFGLRSGHAYSILDYFDDGSSSIRLLLIRNPWGCGEWTGEWSAESKIWSKHPLIRSKIYHKQGDGKFWMSWPDYCRYWSRIQALERSVNIDNLYLEIEEGNCCGPCAGCVKGCCSFFFCCDGLERLYYPRENTEGLNTKRECSCCCCICRSACWAKVACWLLCWLLMPGAGVVLGVLWAQGWLSSHKKGRGPGGGGAPRKVRSGGQAPPARGKRGAFLEGGRASAGTFLELKEEQIIPL